MSQVIFMNINEKGFLQGRGQNLEVAQFYMY